MGPDGLDGRDDRIRQTGIYDKKTGLVAKPTKLDDHVAEYERPWDRPWFQTYMDFQVAPGDHTLEQRSIGYLVSYHYEWGEMAVRGEQASAACPDLLGRLVLGVNEKGEPTAALVGPNGGRTVPFSERNL
jgi:hypothetical protein